MWCDGAADPRPAAAEARQPPGPVQVPAAELWQAPPGRSGLLQSLRQVRRMPNLLELDTSFREDQWWSIKYPISFFRKEYEQHSEEDDQERVQQIMERAVRDAEWILNKYKKQWPVTTV